MPEPTAPTTLCRFDTEGNLITGACSFDDAPGQIQVYDRNGKQIDVFVPPGDKLYTNLALDANRSMAITASDVGKVFAVENWPYPGLTMHPFRRR